MSSSWVSLLAEATSVGGPVSGLGGHALLAIHHHPHGQAPRYEVFHFDGNFDEVSGKPWKEARDRMGRPAYKAYTSVRRFMRMPSTVERLRSMSTRWSNAESGTSGGYECVAVSTGGSSGYSMGDGNPLCGGPDWWRSDENVEEWGIREGYRYRVSHAQAARLIEECMKECAFNMAPPFCIVGADFRDGLNCVTWAYDMLRRCGISFSMKTYMLSFVSPAMAVAAGGRLRNRIRIPCFSASSMEG